MWAFISTTTLTEINIGRCGSRAAGTVVDAELSTIRVTGHNCFDFAVLSYKVLSIGIHGVGAVTKVLFRTVYILEAWDAFTSIVTRMVSVVTRFVLMAASEFERSMPCELWYQNSGSRHRLLLRSNETQLTVNQTNRFDIGNVALCRPCHNDTTRHSQERRLPRNSRTRSHAYIQSCRWQHLVLLLCQRMAVIRRDSKSLMLSWSQIGVFVQ